MATKPKWTVLVYMAADTGDCFYQYAMMDITEMMKARFDDQIRVVVHPIFRRKVCTWRKP